MPKKQYSDFKVDKSLPFEEQFRLYKNAANKWKMKVGNANKSLSDFYSKFGQLDGIPLKNRAPAGEASTNPDFQIKGAGTFKAEQNRTAQVRANNFKLDELTKEAKQLFKEQKIKEIDYKGKKLNSEQFAKVKLKEFKAANRAAELLIKNQPGKTKGHIIDPKGKGSIESHQNWFAETGKGKGGNFSNQNIQRSSHALKTLGLKESRQTHLRNILTDKTPQFTDLQKQNTLEGKGRPLGGVRSTTTAKPNLNKLMFRGGFGNTLFDKLNKRAVNRYGSTVPGGFTQRLRSHEQLNPTIRTIGGLFPQV
tara:strand:- start:43 stop:966 length:924 start_codon:yes stop_codon:yes gene_type:complete